MIYILLPKNKNDKYLFFLKICLLTIIGITIPITVPMTTIEYIEKVVNFIKTPHNPDTING